MPLQTRVPQVFWLEKRLLKRLCVDTTRLKKKPILYSLIANAKVLGIWFFKLNAGSCI